jgi:hypothetical protein
MGLTIVEFLNAFKTLKKNKSPGPDEISNELLMYMGDKAKRALFNMFEAMWDTGHTPSFLKCSDIILLFKKGDRSEVKNYRPITLMDSLLKLYEKVLEVKLKTMVTIPKNQGGCQPNWGSIDTHLVLSELRYESKEKKMIMLKYDLSKAFDRVNRELLWKKLEEKGVHPALIRAIRSTYNNEPKGTSKVKLGKTASEFFRLSNGVKQGSVLSPILFVVYISDLIKTIDKAHGKERTVSPSWGEDYSCLMFVDDLILLANSYPQLTRMVEALTEFLVEHDAVANEGKTKLFTNKKIDSSDKGWAKLNRVSIAENNSTEYLGMIIDNNNESEVKRIIRKMWSKFQTLKSTGLKWDSIDTELGIEMIKKTIVPIIESEAAVRYLSATQHRKIDKNIAKLYKEVFNIPWNAPTGWTLWEAGQLNSEWMHKKAKLRYWRRVTKTATLGSLASIIQRRESLFRREIKKTLIECELAAFINTDFLPEKKVWKKQINMAIEDAHAEACIDQLEKEMGKDWINNTKPFPEIDGELHSALNNTGGKRTILGVRAKTEGFTGDINYSGSPPEECRLCMSLGMRESLHHFLFHCPPMKQTVTALLAPLRKSMDRNKFRRWEEKEERN